MTLPWILTSQELKLMLFLSTDWDVFVKIVSYIPFLKNFTISFLKLDFTQNFTPNRQVLKAKVGSAWRKKSRNHQGPVQDHQWCDRFSTSCCCTLICTILLITLLNTEVLISCQCKIGAVVV